MGVPEQEVKRPRRAGAAKPRQKGKTMKTYTIHNDPHKIVITQTGENRCDVAIYELMGNRWVLLGPVECCTLDFAMEEYGMEM